MTLTGLPVEPATLVAVVATHAVPFHFSAVYCMPVVELLSVSVADPPSHTVFVPAASDVVNDNGRAGVIGSGTFGSVDVAKHVVGGAGAAGSVVYTRYFTLPGDGPVHITCTVVAFRAAGVVVIPGTTV